MNEAHLRKIAGEQKQKLKIYGQGKETGENQARRAGAVA
jgi:hypothetical protein